MPSAQGGLLPNSRVGPPVAHAGGFQALTPLRLQYTSLARLQGCFAGSAEGQAGAPRNEAVHPRAPPALGPAPLLPRLAEQVLFFPFP